MKLMSITEIPVGATFTYLGVEYRMVRQTGKVVDSPNFNQWGRATGGTHKAHKIAVQVNRRHRGWSPVHYTAFYLSTSGLVHTD